MPNLRGRERTKSPPSKRIVKKTVLSLEQALTLPYATQRFAQLGWRVIRIESPADAQGRGGDPNRYIGEETGFDDLHSYYIPPNIGKEAITLNLKTKEGQELLRTLIRELPVDVFLCNTLPKRYQELGIDYQTLHQANPDLIWCGISAFGPALPDRAGYDPAMQALLGYMYLTGDPDGEPMLCGLPIIDLRAGDEAFTQVILAILNQHDKSGGREIHISMAQCAAAWLITALPQLQFTDDESKLFKRSANEHRSFIPCNCYPTKDGFVYLAIGNDLQWQKLIQINGFDHLDQPERRTNMGRLAFKDNIYADIRAGLMNYTTAEFLTECHARSLSAAPVNSTHDVAALDFVRDNMLETTLPSGYRVPMFPPPCPTDFLIQNGNQMSCAPRHGEHNTSVLGEIGLTLSEIESLREKGVI